MKKILATTTEVAEAVVVVVGCEEEESVFTGLLLPQLDRLQLSINNQTQTPVVGLTWILEYLLLSKSSSKDALLLQPQQLNPLVRNRLLKHQTTSTTVTSSSPAPPPPPYISLLTSGFTCHACANPLLIHIDKCTPYTTPRFTSIHHLPSTYWTELIDCWSCHTEDYLSKFTLDSSKSNITRDGRVLPRNSSTVLVGEEVVMVHADAIDFVNGVRGVGGSSDDETDGGNNRPLNKWTTVKCKRCSSFLGEVTTGRNASTSEKNDGDEGDNRLAVKLFKYCIDVCNVNDPDIHLDASTEKVPYTPFITYFTNTLLQLANVHATYRVMIYEEDSFSNVLQQKEESNHNESSGCSGSDEDIIEEMETSDPDRHRLRLLVWLMNPSVYVFSNAFRALKVEEEEEEKKKTATTSTINTPFYSDLKRVFGGVSCDSLTQSIKVLYSIPSSTPLTTTLPTGWTPDKNGVERIFLASEQITHVACMLRAGSLLLSPADRTVDMQQSDHSSTLIGSGEWDVALLPRASTRLDLKDILKDVDRVGRREE